MRVHSSLRSSFHLVDEIAGIGSNFGLRVCSKRHPRPPPRHIRSGTGGSTPDLNFRIEWALVQNFDRYVGHHRPCRWRRLQIAIMVKHYFTYRRNENPGGEAGVGARPYLRNPKVEKPAIVYTTQ